MAYGGELYGIASQMQQRDDTGSPLKRRSEKGKKAERKIKSGFLDLRHNKMTNGLIDLIARSMKFDQGKYKDCQYDVLIRNYNGRGRSLLVEVKSSTEQRQTREAVGQRSLPARSSQQVHDRSRRVVPEDAWARSIRPLEERSGSGASGTRGAASNAFLDRGSKPTPSPRVLLEDGDRFGGRRGVHWRSSCKSSRTTDRTNRAPGRRRYVCACCCGRERTDQLGDNRRG